MLISNINNLSSMSMVKAKVDLYAGDTLVRTCTCGDVLESFTITREGDTSKFYGFGVCQKLDIAFIDLNRELAIYKDNTAVIGLGDGEIWDNPYPTFYINEVQRDERTNTITATAYDKLYNAAGYVFDDLGIEAPYSLRDIAEAAALMLGLTLRIDTAANPIFSLLYEEGANLEGTEDLRSILNAIAEMTQTVYFIDTENNLYFRRMDKDGEAVYTISRDEYYELNTMTARQLAAICNATELGDNLEANNGGEGVTQYIRNNPFLELRADISNLLEYALSQIGGFSLTQFVCDWAGNYLLEIGDKIALVTEDGGIVTSYMLSDVVSYAGTLNEVTEWEYSEQSSDTPSNPTNIGEKINQTFAKVDKVTKQITLVASQSDENAESIGQIQVKTDSVEAGVKNIQTVTNEKIDSLSGEIETLTNEVNLKLSAEDVTIAIKNTLNTGVDKVVTSTKKYTFDDTGLRIGSSDSSINTTVSEDGMRIDRDGQEVLTADNTGVKAEDLHATTYLIIGNNSRFEDWQNQYTACFWIGD